MTRALVTGATGLVGSHIVERLLARRLGRSRARARSPSRDARLQRSASSPRSGDVLDRRRASRAPRTACDVIFHTAAAITPSGGWEAYRRLNVDGTANAIAAAERRGARLLQLSSVAVYGPTGRYRDDGAQDRRGHAARRRCPSSAYYARSKRESEQLVMDAHARGRIWATAVRPDVIYGTRDRQFVPRIARMLRRGVRAAHRRRTSRRLPIVHAANVADGAVRAAMYDVAGGRAYNLANDFDVTVRRFFELGAHGLGRRVRFIPVPLAVAHGAVRRLRRRRRMRSPADDRASSSNASLSMLTRDNPFTSERARRELGWSPTRAAGTRRSRGVSLVADESAVERSALKEWAVLVDAMARGEIVAMVRKGGIREQRAGFSVRHDRFLLYPTFFHEKVNELAPRYRGEARRRHTRESRRRARFASSMSPMSSACGRSTELETLRAIEGEHGMSWSAVESRFHYKNKPGVQVIAVRVSKLRAAGRGAGDAAVSRLRVVGGAGRRRSTCRTRRRCSTMRV